MSVITQRSDIKQSSKQNSKVLTASIGVLHRPVQGGVIGRGSVADELVHDAAELLCREVGRANLLPVMLAHLGERAHPGRHLNDPNEPTIQ